MQLECSEIGQPSDCGYVLCDEIIDRLLTVRYTIAIYPVWSPIGFGLGIKLCLPNAIWIANQGERAAFDVLQQVRCHGDIILNDLSLGYADLRIDQLIEITQFEFSAFDFGMYVFGGQALSGVFRYKIRQK